MSLVRPAPPTAPPRVDLAAKRDGLLDTLRDLGRVAVAYSGGVDSAVVAKAAALACGDGAVAVTAVSPSLAAGELETAKNTAAAIGVRHRVVHTAEFADADYVKNAPDRCYFCKSTLYDRLAELAGELGVDAVVNGANVDDRGDHRPGMRAAAERGVRSPLLELGFTKADVRDLARHWHVPVWDKPASPCLASRIAYGTAVTPDRVRRVDAAEAWLRERFGLRTLRVRCLPDDSARVEVPHPALPRLIDDHVAVAGHLRGLGFTAVAVDLEGFRSGSLNVVAGVGGR